MTEIATFPVELLPLEQGLDRRNYFRDFQCRNDNHAEIVRVETESSSFTWPVCPHCDHSLQQVAHGWLPGAPPPSLYSVVSR